MNKQSLRRKNNIGYVGNDGRTSTDFEDIIFVLNYRNAIRQELMDAPESVKLFLKDEFKTLLNVPYINEWISCHLEHAEQRRVNLIIGSLTEFVISL